jgi:3-oxoadipate enol-lactonase
MLECIMPVLNLQGLALYYEVTGTGLPLLLIHGLGSSSRNWEKQVELFAKEYTVITPDLRGHGRSSRPPGPYCIRDFAEDIVALIRTLRVEPLHVVGTSMGGMVALELAIYFPELVRSLTIVNSYPEMRIDTLHKRMQVWRRSLFFGMLGMRGMGVLLSRHLFPIPDKVGLRRLFIQRWAENDKRALRASARAILNWDVERYLGEIGCPVLVMASDRDYRPLEEKQAYATKMPNARMAVIEDARHAVALERPEEFNTVLGEFLAEMDV